MFTISTQKELSVNEEEQLKRLLLSDDVTTYHIIEENKPVLLHRGVGSKINSNYFGTVGGFARRTFPNRTSEICGLTAGHVAKQLFPYINISDMNFELAPEQQLRCNRPNVDIAAFTIPTELWQSINNDAYFKTGNADGAIRPCTVWNFGTCPYLLPVYKRGATTSLTYGKIVGCQVNHDQLSNVVHIESLGSFAKDGDSGSILCNDSVDGINAMAMCLGQVAWDGINQITFAQSLEFGLQMLSEESGTEFSLSL